MHSLFVKPEERASIFENGQRGKLAESRKDLKGEGIGMGRIKHLMALNNGDFIAVWGDKIDVSDYVNNRFTFQLKLSKPKRHGR